MQGYSTVNSTRISCSYLSYLHRCLVTKHEQPPILTLSHSPGYSLFIQLSEYLRINPDSMSTHDNAMHAKARTELFIYIYLSTILMYMYFTGVFTF